MKLSILSTLLLSISSLALSSPVDMKKRTNRRWDYNDDKLYGVNLGGWFVLEPYITPSLFNQFGSNISVDEYHYCQYLGEAEATKRLTQHWSSWYVENDFAQMPQYGLNMVRIPIGYWAFKKLDSDPYVQGQEAYLDQALAWCKKYGLKAWIDLHGAPGSQNGFDNSGLRDTYEWQSVAGNVQLTLDVLDYISSKYSAEDYVDTVIGIELINEPLGPILDQTKLINFYNNGYQTVRKSGDVPVIFHDAFFQTPGYWDNVLNNQIDGSVWDTVIDHHHYQVFSTGELQRDINAHVAQSCQWGRDSANEYHWAINGEWSAALTDCATWLNGVGRGNRYENQYDSSAYIGSCSDVLSGSIDVPTYRKYVESQLDAFTHGGKNKGWVFWCYKTENAVEWDFTKLVTLNVIPQPLSDRWYPNQCGY
ncbi:hydrolase activity, hydrolyzing O-glycosyl compounds protein [[Candida] boidinii]|nr:hydrolase activity, hydrolyzing O-glycosyl compounds protein [[Candida] boidinii]